MASASPESLNGLYRACNTAAEQVRRIVARLKVRYRYCRLVCELKGLLCCQCCRKMTHEGGIDPHHKDHEADRLFCWAICTLHRIEREGIDADSTIDEVKITDDVRQMLEMVRDSLQSVMEKAQAVGQSKNGLDKHLAGTIQQSCDLHLENVEAHLRQIADMGDHYLLTIV